MRNRKLRIYLGFSFILLLSMTYRASYIYQQGGDTWAMCVRAVTITNYGYAPWISDPLLSFYGFYPYSYPSGEHFLISAFQQLTGLPITYTAYLLSFLFLFPGLLNLFILSNTINRSHTYSLLAIFLFSNFDFFIDSTWNNLSTRGLFTIMYPIILFLIFRLKANYQFNYFSLAIFCFLVTASIHRMSLLLLGVLVLPYIFYYFYTIFERYSPTLNEIKNKLKPNHVVVIIVIIFLAQISGFTVRDYTEFEGYNKDVFPGENLISDTFNLLAS